MSSVEVNVMDGLHNYCCEHLMNQITEDLTVHQSADVRLVDVCPSEDDADVVHQRQWTMFIC